MATKDAAFMWETEALRSLPSAPPEAPGSAERDDGWATLRETEALTGIPISTLRKWVRKDAVPSFIAETEAGPIRMLWLQGVTQRGEVLGRDMTLRETIETPDESVSNGIVEIDLDEVQHEGVIQLEPDQATAAHNAETGTGERETQPPDAEKTYQPNPEPRPGTMVVPIEAWDKMLLQLGNLHQAGQQLAEARERAGKAETEAKFLRERLSELKTEPASRPVASPQLDPAPELEPAPKRRVNIEVEEEGDEIEVREPVIEAETPVVEEEMEEAGTSLSSYSIEVIKHLYGTWRDRPRR